MKKAKVLLFLLISACVISAQKAPNFTITDYENKTHNLYDDYLDNDMVVMLKIMFVACPPCNLVAPDVQKLYEEFGEGSKDVQFIDLSNKSWDDNDALKGYSEKHSLTFPGAGADGGSLSAVSPYTSGQFGRFLGTPTFVIIKPDRTVNFDIPMQNLKSAIEDALDGGCATTFGGGINSESASPKVFLKSDIIGSKVFELDVNNKKEYNYNCEFTFPPQGSDYFVNVEADGGDIDGITTKDIVILQRHLLAIKPITLTEQKIAADFTANGILSVRDISEIRKLILGRTSENRHHNSWIFWHETSDFSHDSSGVKIPDLITRVPLMDVVSKVLTGNFSGVKLGDISGDINPFFTNIKTRNPLELALKYDNAYVKEGELISIEFIIDNSIPLAGIQIGFDNSIDINSLSFNSNWETASNVTKVDQRWIAYGKNITYTVDKPIIYFSFIASRNGMLSDMLSLSSDMPSLATNGLDDIKLILTPNQISNEVNIFPNPSTGQVTIQSNEIIQSIEVINNSGTMLSYLDVSAKNFQFDLENQKGIQWVRINWMNGKSKIQKLVKL